MVLDFTVEHICSRFWIQGITSNSLTSLTVAIIASNATCWLTYTENILSLSTYTYNLSPVSKCLEPRHKPHLCIQESMMKSRILMNIWCRFHQTSLSQTDHFKASVPPNKNNMCSRQTRCAVFIAFMPTLPKHHFLILKRNLRVRYSICQWQK